MALRWSMAVDYGAMSRMAAESIFTVIRRGLVSGRPVMLGLATGNTMLGLYERLAAMLNESRCDLSQLYTLNLDEYLGADGCWIPENHPLSYRGYMARNFFGRLDAGLHMDPGHMHFPDPAKPESTDDWVQEMGGMDLQLLGLGFNGHIGFNEPTPEEEIATRDFAALPSRHIELEELTIETNARLTAGGDRSLVPTRAVTVGMRTILASKEILLLACFAEQREALSRMLKGGVTPELPASYLNEHPSARVLWAEDPVGLAPEVEGWWDAPSLISESGVRP